MYTVVTHDFYISKFMNNSRLCADYDVMGDKCIRTAVTKQGA